MYTSAESDEVTEILLPYKVTTIVSMMMFLGVSL